MTPLWFLDDAQRRFRTVIKVRILAIAGVDADILTKPSEKAPARAAIFAA